MASFPANAFGLFDATGNVWELTSDCMRRDIVRMIFGQGAWQLGVGLVLGLGLALLAVQPLRGRRFFRLVFLLPLTITPVAPGTPGDVLQGRIRYLEHHGHESLAFLDIGATAIVLGLPRRVAGASLFGKTVETVLADRPCRVIIESSPGS